MLLFYERSVLLGGDDRGFLKDGSKAYLIIYEWHQCRLLTRQLFYVLK